MTPAERSKAMDELLAAEIRLAAADEERSCAEYGLAVADTEAQEHEAQMDFLEAEKMVYRAEDEVRRLKARFPECRYRWTRLLGG